MAIDTAAKRYSMMNFGINPIIPLIIPDGTISAPDRAHFLNLYSGITLSSVSPPVFSGSLSNLDVSRGSTKTVDYSGYFADETSFSISPAVESDWTFNTTSGVLVVNGVIEGNYGPYTITATNAGGSDSSNEFYISVRAASVGGNYGRKPIEEYEEEIRLILKEEEKTVLKEKKSLKKEEVKLEAKIEKQSDRQKEKTKLKLLEVSESLLQVEKDLIEITKKRAEISLRARILRDDDEVIALLMREGYL